ncbi:hypothetical protein SBV1_740030 [Verrucomicrobia bacterium]|nr:hypothetical protein SBV1_740030 [Verrucomicrobiota bacterium]
MGDRTATPWDTAGDRNAAFTRQSRRKPPFRNKAGRLIVVVCKVGIALREDGLGAQRDESAKSAGN